MDSVSEVAELLPLKEMACSKNPESLSQSHVSPGTQADIGPPVSSTIPEAYAIFRPSRF
jgi:hypothetical protein